MAISLIVGIYFALTGLYAFKKSKRKAVSNKLNKFGILIACRNEEQVIGELIDSIKKNDYDKKYYDIIVIPNNCTDHTKERALECGAKIIDVDIPTKTKGEVLKYTFNKLKDSDYDAYIIIDADNLLHENFLSKMNEALNSGFLVAQGFRDAKNPSDNWITGSYAMFYYIQNFFFNKARMSLNASAAINGTGFCVAKKIIDELGFNTKTLTEDSEFTGICAINNIQVGFVKDAITYDEHPLKFKDSWHQRKRWTTGTISCLKLYAKDLLKTFFKAKKISALDMFLFYSAPLIQLVAFLLPTALFIWNFCVGLMHEKIVIDYGSILFFILLYVLNVLLNIFIIKLYKKDLKTHMKGIVFFPFFILTWIPINLVCLFKKETTWKPIKHTRNIEIEHISN